MILGPTVLRRFEDGDFPSIAIHQNRLYAAEKDKSRIRVFLHDTTWMQLQPIEIPSSQQHYWSKNITLHAKRNGTILVMYDQKIHAYSNSGNLLETCEPGLCKRCGTKKQMYMYPKIYYDGEDDSVLIVDSWWSGGIQVMNTQGELRSLELDTSVPEPRCAVVLENYLYVTSCGISNRNNVMAYIHKFSC